ncbi:MAG: hypothetical protein QW101_06510 [Ignisphaera sp.]
MNKKLFPYIVSLFLFISMISNLACIAMQSDRDQKRSASFIITVDEWVLEFHVSFPWVWIAGSVVDIDTVFRVREVGKGGLTIYSLRVSTGEIDVSKYVGMFSRVGEEKSITLSLPTIDPRYLFDNKSSTLIDLYIYIGGYVESYKGREFFTRNFTVRAIPVNILPSVVRLSLSVDKYDAIYIIDVQASNNYPNPLHNVYLMMYVNSSLYTSVFYRIMSPFNITSTRFPLPTDKQGVYIITAVINYTTSEGFVGYSIASTKIYVKGVPRIILQINTSVTYVFKPVRLYGSANPVQGLKLILETSIDGIDWNRVEEISTDNEGRFSYVWIPNTSGIHLFRVRNIESELLRESLSNIVAVSVEKVKPSISFELDKEAVEVGRQVKIRVAIEPKMKTPVTILYISPKEYSWRTYTNVTTDSSGFAETIFIPTTPGEYKLKAIVKETSELYSAESSIKTLRVEETTQLQQTTIPQKPREEHAPQFFVQEYRNYVVIALIIVAAVFSSLLYFKRR